MQTYTHAIIYVGAPYGDTESGHVVSRHTRAETAARRYRDTYKGTMGIYDHAIVPLAPDGTWDRSDGGGLGYANDILQGLA
jgi:hypothetical protein